MTMNYFKPLNYENYSALQQSAVKWLLDRDLIHGEYRNLNTRLNLEEALAGMPLINDLLSQLGKTCRDVYVQRTIRSFNFEVKDALHVDFTKNLAMIEIPVIGCSHSERVFYHAKVTGVATTIDGLPYWVCDASTAQEVARVRVEQPTVLRMGVPSKIELERSFVNRVSLMIMANEDCYHLLGN